MKCYDEAAAALRLVAAQSPSRGSMRDGDWLIGWGCATASLSDPCWRRGRARAALRERQGRACRSRRTISAPAPIRWSAQMAAERLGVPVDAGDGRARRQRPAAGAGRRRLDHHRQRLLGRAKACDAIRDKLVRPRRPEGRADAGRRRSAARRLPDASSGSASARDRGICRVRARTASSRRRSTSSTQGSSTHRRRLQKATR